MASMHLPVFGGLSTIIDDDLFNVEIPLVTPSGLVIPVTISQCSWHTSVARRGHKYVVACKKRKVDGQWKSIVVKLHRLVARALPYQIVDHINRDRLDNRAANLRIVTANENAINSRKRASVSKYRGVCFDHGKWKAAIKSKGVQKHLGLFTSEESAARAYDEAAVRLFGEFAVLNFPSQSIPVGAE